MVASLERIEFHEHLKKFDGPCERTSARNYCRCSISTFIDSLPVLQQSHCLAVMLPSRCTRSSLQLLSDSSLLAPNALRSSIPRIAYFSTTPILPGAVLTKKRKGPLVPTKRGSPTSFNPRQKKGVVASSKRPAPGERKALRKRIVLSNNNALAVSSLVDLNEVNALSKENAGKVMGLPEEALDVLRTVGAFKPTQAWALFRRPAVLMRQETMRLVDLFTEVELSAGTQEEMKTLRRILSGERKAGKSILLLQSLVMALLRNWFIINIPEGKLIMVQRDQ